MEQHIHQVFRRVRIYQRWGRNENLVFCISSKPKFEADAMVSKVELCTNFLHPMTPYVDISRSTTKMFVNPSNPPQTLSIRGPWVSSWTRHRTFLIQVSGIPRCGLSIAARVQSEKSTASCYRIAKLWDAGF